MTVLLAVLVLASVATSQQFPPERATAWSLAGLVRPLPSPETVVSLESFGGRGDGTFSNDAAWEAAVQRLGGRPGRIDIPSGTWLFTRTLTLPSGTSLAGRGADSTILRFDLGGRAMDCITIGGGGLPQATIPVREAARRGDRRVRVRDSVNTLRTGAWCAFVIDDSDLVTSDWARGTVRQLVLIEDIRGDTLVLRSPLRMDLPLDRSPRVAAWTPAAGASISCLAIERLDATNAQTSLVTVSNAVDCAIIGVAGRRTNFAHVDIRHSANILVRGCAFRDAFAFGGGGQGYGVVLQSGASECLVENTVFARLRHSMLLQSGANGNVLAYNHSVEPFWTSSTLPSNSAGDMVLHGNWPFFNLFEGNVCQNIVIDNSHGRNGPFNTFFRNRAELYGIFMNTDQPSDRQTFVGNEVINTGFALGLYLLAGTDHLQYGNVVRGALRPPQSAAPAEASLYRETAPTFWTAGMMWPSVGPPAIYMSGRNPAAGRGFTTDCHNDGRIPAGISAPVPPRTPRLFLFPTPSRGDVRTHDSSGPVRHATYTVHTPDGTLVRSSRTDATGRIDASGLPAGAYLLLVGGRSSGTFIILPH